MSTPNLRKRILFVAENATLAQIVRLAVLARGLDPRRYEVHFACAGFDPLIFDGFPGEQHSIYSLPRETVERASAKGKPIFGIEVLEQYIADELALFEGVNPDAVVGDFRLSLSTSTALARIPFAMLINAYWSPHALRDRFPVPDHPMVRLLGESLVERVFPRVIPRVFAAFARPINEVRRRHGLGPIGSMLEVLTHGDWTLFPDTPWLVPTVGAPATNVYLGPVLWSPEMPLPSWWNALPDGKPIVYVTLGSSGLQRCLPVVLRALAKLDVTVLLSTAGRALPDGTYPNVFSAPYLPGDRAAARAALVVSNGGSSTGYQALAAGTPVLGLATNFDQFLAMTAIAKVGAGVLLRAGTLKEALVREKVSAMLATSSFGEAAKRAAVDFASYDCRARFASELEKMLSRPARAVD